MATLGEYDDDALYAQYGFVRDPVTNAWVPPGSLSTRPAPPAPEPMALKAREAPATIAECDPLTTPPVVPSSAPSQTPNAVRCVHVLINSADRVSGSATDFSVRLDQDMPLRNVLAVRPLRIEFYDTTESLAELVINGASVPLQVTTSQGALLALNGWNRMRTTGTTSTVPVFHRIVSGVETLPAPANNDSFPNDPYTYVLRPPEQKLSRFDVKLVDLNQAPLTTTPTLVMLLAVYCSDV